MFVFLYLIHKFSYSLATGTQVGVIEVVRDAKTVYKIQQESSRLAGKRKASFLSRVCSAILVVTWYLNRAFTRRLVLDAKDQFSIRV